MARLTLIATALSLSTLAMIAPPAAAQDSVSIQFERGRSGTTVNGTILGDEYIDYVLRANANQTMNVTLNVGGTNGNGSIYFNILPQGQDYGALFVGSRDGRTASVRLPDNGEYAIRVYLTGNDRDTNKTVGYSLDISITGSSGSASRPDGLLPEEDIFVVTVASDDSLNVRNAPRPSGRRLGSLRNGTAVSNTGGCTMSDGQQWCRIRDPRSGLEGWVNARYLRLPR